MKKRHVYEVVEGESPMSSTPSSPFVQEKHGTCSTMPNIFPRKTSSLAKNSSNISSNNSYYDNELESNVEMEEHNEFGRVTLI